MAPIAFPPSPHTTHVLTRHMPQWLLAGTAAQRAQYRQRLLDHLASTARAASIHRRLRPPTQFCAPLLNQALTNRFNIEVDVTDTELVRLHYQYSLEGRRRVPQRQTLLEAAMANFEVQERFEPKAMILPVGEYRLVLEPVVGYRHDPGKVLPIPAEAFAALCRELDLGRQYQAHVTAVLSPPPGDLLGTWPAHSLNSQLADALRLQISRAVMTGDIDSVAAQMLESLLQEGGSPLWQGVPAQLCALRALVTWVHAGTLLGGLLVVRQHERPDGPCVLYLPGANERPLLQFEHFAALAADLRQRLRDRGFRQYFQRFVPAAERASFFTRLVDTLSPEPFSLLFPKPRKDDPQADIGLRAEAIDTALVAQLHRDLMAGILGDARWCVVPTGDEDRQAREQRLQGLLEAGLDLLNLSALFVPGVGVIMAAVGVAQLLGEAFVGIDDWTHGQTQQAVGHFFSVAENLALLAGGAAAHVAIERSPFVEGMLPVLDGQGRERLWNAQLADFSVPDTLPGDLAANPLGQYQHQGQWYIRMAGKLYRQRYDEASATWQIEHPDGRDLRVPLRHNGQGAWRAAHEQPRQWRAGEALGRLGPLTQGLDEASLDIVRHASGLSETQVQDLHLRQRPLPAMLQASLADFRAQADVAGLPEAERGAAFAQLRDGPSAVAAEHPAYALCRDFPGLPLALAEELLASSTARERRWMQTRGRVPLRLAERAHAQLRAWRLNRAITGLLLPDSVWPHTRQLRQGLLGASDTGDTAAPALARRAVEDPQAAAGLIGQRPANGRLRLPQRQANGRWGYPLSGRQMAATAPLRERLRGLYPEVDEATLDMLHQQLGEVADQEANFQALHMQYRQLTATLIDWADEQEGALEDDEQREARNEAMARILAVWRRDPEYFNYSNDQVSGYELDLADLPLGRLPALTADFAHVEQLGLEEAGLAQDPSPFLQAFTGLRGLELQSNRLLVIPEAVARMPGLRELHLDGNLLLPGETMFAPLAGLPELELLNLQNMHMEIPEAAFAQLAQLPALRDLGLSGTSESLSDVSLACIAQLPRLEYLWLRNTGLTLSAERAALLGGMRTLQWLDLSDNPLGDDADLSALTQLVSLDVSRCRLTRWPTGLSALMAADPLRLSGVSITDNPIVEVPSLQDMALFARPVHELPPLRISRAGLSVASLNHLHEVDLEPIEVNGSTGPDWLLGCPPELRTRVDEWRNEPRARFFLTALNRSVETQDYRTDPPAGRLRIQQLIGALGQGPEQANAVDLEPLRRQLFDIGEEVMTTCGDGVQLFLRRCETLVQVFEVAQQAAVDGDLARLARLGRGFYREHLLDEVAGRLYDARVERRQVLFPHAIHRGANEEELALVNAALEQQAPALMALDDVDSAGLMDLPDEAEIRLRLRIDLAQRLELPPQPRQMRYFQAISDHVRDAVVEAVQVADNPASRRAWILEQAWWRQCVQQHWQARFQQLREHWYAGDAYLMALDTAQAPLEAVPMDVMRPLETFMPEHQWQVEGVPQRVVLTEADAEAARQRLGSARRAAEDALLLALSAPVLGDQELA